MKRAAVFFDRDNTLIASDGYLGNPKQVVLVEGAADAVAKSRSYGFVAVTFSNQSGVARGMFAEADVDAVNRRMDELLLAQNGRAVISRHEYCPYHPEATVEKYREDSPLRKPKPGMILAAGEKLNLDLVRSWVIGDAPRDIEAGKAAGCKTILFRHPTLSQSPAAMEESAVEPDFTAASLKEAIDIVGREMYKRPGVPGAQEKPKETQEPAPAAASTLEPAPIESPLPAPVAEAISSAVVAEHAAPIRPSASASATSSVMSYSTLDSDAGLLLPPDDHDAGLNGLLGGFAPMRSSNTSSSSSGTALMEAPPAVEPQVSNEPEPVGAPIASTPEPAPTPAPSPAPVQPRVERATPAPQPAPRPAPVVEAPKPEPTPMPTPRTESRPEPRPEQRPEPRPEPRVEPDPEPARHRTKREEPVVAQAAAPITISTAKLESISEQILSELRRRREEPSDFSVSKLMAGIVQVLVLAILFLSYLQRENPAVLQNWLLFAIALQTLTIALLIMGRQK